MGIIQPGKPLNSCSNAPVDEINTPSSDCTSSGCSSSCSPFSAPACPENHAVETIVERFDASVQISNSWTIPDCNGTATLIVPDLVVAAIGSFLWHPDYGYFEIVSFDTDTGELLVRNNCTEGNAAAGTEVPSCTTFIVSDPPCPSILEVTPFVALDFTAPDVSDCVQIGVTSTIGLVAGQTIEISTGQYELNAIISDSVIEICNEGDGITPGTLVEALDGSGNFQYPITVVEVNVVFSDSTVGAIVNISSGNVDEEIECGVSIDNTTQIAELVYYSVNAYVDGALINANANRAVVQFQLQISIDGGAFTDVVNFTKHQFNFSDVTSGAPQELSYTGIETVAPNTTKTIDAKVIVTWISGATVTYRITDAPGTNQSGWRIEINGLGIVS